MSKMLKHLTVKQCGRYIRSTEHLTAPSDTAACLVGKLRGRN